MCSFNPAFGLRPLQTHNRQTTSHKTWRFNPAFGLRPLQTPLCDCAILPFSGFNPAFGLRPLQTVGRFMNEYSEVVSIPRSCSAPFRHDHMIEWLEEPHFQSRVRAQAASDLSMIVTN